MVLEVDGLLSIAAAVDVEVSIRIQGGPGDTEATGGPAAGTAKTQTSQGRAEDAGDHHHMRRTTAARWRRCRSPLPPLFIHLPTDPRRTPCELLLEKQCKGASGSTPPLLREYARLTLLARSGSGPSLAFGFGGIDGEGIEIHWPCTGEWRPMRCDASASALLAALPRLYLINLLLY